MVVRLEVTCVEAEVKRKLQPMRRCGLGLEGEDWFGIWNSLLFKKDKKFSFWFVLPGVGCLS